MKSNEFYELQKGDTVTVENPREEWGEEAYTGKIDFIFASTGDVKFRHGRKPVIAHYSRLRKGA